MTLTATVEVFEPIPDAVVEFGLSTTGRRARRQPAQHRRRAAARHRSSQGSTRSARSSTSGCIPGRVRAGPRPEHGRPAARPSTSWSGSCACRRRRRASTARSTTRCKPRGFVRPRSEWNVISDVAISELARSLTAGCRGSSRASMRCGAAPTEAPAGALASRAASSTSGSRYYHAWYLSRELRARSAGRPTYWTSTTTRAARRFYHGHDFQLPDPAGADVRVRAPRLPRAGA